MIRLQDSLLLVVSYSGIVAGVLFPRLGAPFQGIPLYCMMALLFLSFLSVPLGDMVETLHHEKGRVSYLLLLKLIVLPGVVFVVFHRIAPGYALAALLLSAASTGVIAPFFAGILPADIPLVVVMLVASSLLMPLTLPVLVQGLMGRTVEMPFLPMVEMLCAVVFIPFALAEALKRSATGAMERLVRWRFGISLFLFGITNLAIFSKYASHVLQAPATLVNAFVVAVLLAALYLAIALVASWKMPLPQQLSVMICCSIMNNILILVFSSRFFGARESAVAAMYTVPFFLMIVPLRLYQRWRLASTGAR
jgi:BASS family bile acid:Na+ symporter